MVDVAKVRLYGTDIGMFRWDERRQVAEFEYADSFAGRHMEPSPLMMPVREGMVYSFPGIGRETFKGLPGMMADSLPDTYGRALLDRWLALTGRYSSNPIETLCFLGKRCMGALEFEPAMDLTYDSGTRFEIDSLVNVASEALSEKEDFGVNLSADKKAAIRYTQSDGAPYLKVETDQNILDLLEIGVQEKELVVRPKNRHIGINPTRFVVITNSTALKELEMAGDGDCNLGKGLSGEELDIKLAGRGTVIADSVALTRLDCEIAGSGTVCLSGKAGEMNIKSAGSSEIKAFGLETEKIHCHTAGSAQIEIFANKEISAKIAGSGIIRYKGNPDIKEKSIAGSGSITKVD